LGQGGEDFAHYVVDVGGGQEIAGEGGGHFRAQAVGFEELVLDVGVKQAKRCVIFMPEHAALAVVGEGELAEFRVVGAWFGHLGSPLEERFLPQRAQRRTGLDLRM